MIVVCNSCNTRLQLDDSKIPARAFSVKCPKCQNVLNVSPQSPVDSSAVSVDQNPAPDSVKYRPPTPAPLFRNGSSRVDNNVPAGAPQSVPDTGDLAAVLAKLLETGAKETSQTQGWFNWERRRVLLCVAPAHRENIAALLADNNFQVYLAENATQAIDRMREERIEVVILDNDFDQAEQGFAFVTNEVNHLRPPARRRTIFAQILPSVRTGDSHAAFVNNVNVVFNPSDLEQIPQLLERTMRDLNQLYQNFNVALSAPGL